MKNIKKDAFTIVELIVVITILVILASISYISLQSYTSDARNSKRVSELKSIEKLINLKNVDGIDLINFVLNDSNTLMDDLNNLNGGLFFEDLGSIGGYTSGIDYNYYKAGDINYNLLGTTFSDPLGGEYKLGVCGERYQIAATLENNRKEHESYVIGNYSPRRDGYQNINGIKDDVNKTFTLTGANIGKFYKGDRLTVWKNSTINNGYSIISRVSNDGSILYFDDYFEGATISLSPWEVDNIISKHDTREWNIKTINSRLYNPDKLEDLVPYKYE